MILAKQGKLTKFLEKEICKLYYLLILEVVMNSRRIIAPIIVGIVFILISGCSSIEKDWGKATQENTLYSYHLFNIKHEKSKYRAEALSRIEILKKEIVAKKEREEDIKKIRKEESDYKRVIESESIRYLEEFLADYPDSPKSSEIKSRITTLETKFELITYQRAIRSGSFSDLNLYLRTYPNGPHIDEIKQRINSFSWKNLKKSKFINWEQLGIKEPISQNELNDYIKRSSFITCIKGDAAVRSLATSFLFIAKGSEVKSRGAVLPTEIQISGSMGISKITTMPGTCLLTFNNEYYVLAVGSVIYIRGTDSGVDFFGHYIQKGTLTVYSKGIELQKGTRILSESE